MAILVEAHPDTATVLRSAIGPGDQVDNLASLRRLLETSADDLVVVGPDIDLDAACDLAAAERTVHPARGFVLLRRRVDAAVLGQALKSGVREVVAADNLQALNEACRASGHVSAQLRSVQQLPQSAVAMPQAKCITVFSAKGGCGKTTVSTNLAAAMAAQGSRVGLIDLDLAFGDVAIALQLFPSRTIADAVALSGHIDQTAVASLVTAHSHNLDTVLAPIEPGLADAIPAATVGELIRVMKSLYDYVVVDTPPAFTEQVLVALDESDVHLLLATLDVPAVKNLKLTMETLDMLGLDKEQRMLVLNRADASVGLSVADVAKTLGARIALEVPSSRAVPTSINRGVPIVTDQPNHAVSQAFKKFAKAHFPPVAQGRPRRDRRSFSVMRRGDQP
ncbi:MAG: pilus assembly protein CpaE [Frankiales bacterium]|jgi:pilus assembly protein CpaE|nr:pilus assembly protein CpaE [Frankiales bacterium]